MTDTKKELWQLVNEDAQEILKRSDYELEEFAKTEPRMIALRLRQFAVNDISLRSALHSEAWGDYHRHRDEWLKTYNAVLGGKYASHSIASAENLHEQATYAADLCHKPLPEKPAK